MEKPAYRRILLKLSGEALMGSQSFGIDEPVVAEIADEVREVVVRERGAIRREGHAAPQLIAETHDREVDCEEFLAHVATLVEARRRGEPIPPALARVPSSPSWSGDASRCSTTRPRSGRTIAG